jgi:hypothetical protein
VLGVLPDLRAVVDRVPEHDLRLGSVSGEDQFLHLISAIAGTIQAEQLVVETITVTDGSGVETECNQSEAASAASGRHSATSLARIALRLPWAG